MGPGSRRALRGLVPVAVLAAAWEAAPRAGLVDPAFLPPAGAVLGAWGDLAWSGELPRQVLVTARAWAQGFVLAAVLGIAGGLVMAFLPTARAMFSLVVELLRPMPSVAIIPIAILVLGLGDAMKVAVIAYAALWPILLNSLYGVDGVERRLHDVARTFHLGRWRTAWRILLPAASPLIATGLRVSSGIALILAVTAELVAGQSGLGSFILQAQLAIRVAEMYAGILTVAVLGFGLNLLLGAVEGRMLAWHRGATAKETA